MKNSIKIILIVFTVTLFSTSCNKSKDDICDTNKICYTQAPDELYVKLELSTNPTIQPIDVSFYIGNLDDGELFEQFFTNNNTEYFLMPINKRYTATARYIVEGDTVMVINSDRLSNQSYKNCDETCYDWDDEMVLNLKLSK